MPAMNKKTFLLIILFLVVIFGSAFGYINYKQYPTYSKFIISKALSKTNTYENSDFGVSIEYPSDWEFIESWDWYEADGIFSIAVIQPGAKKDISGRSIQGSSNGIQIQFISKAKQPELVDEALKTNFDEKKYNVQNIKLGKLSGITYEYKSIEKMNTYSTKGIVFDGDKYLILGGISWKPGDLDGKKTLEAILSSVKFD